MPTYIFLYDNVALFIVFPSDEISKFMIKVKHELAQNDLTYRITSYFLSEVCFVCFNELPRKYIDNPESEQLLENNYYKMSRYYALGMATNCGVY